MVTFVNTYGAGVNALDAVTKAAYIATVEAVEAFFQQQFTDDVTLRVTFDYAALNPGHVAGDGYTLASNNFSLTKSNYNDIKAALAAHQSSNDSNPGDDAAAVGALPGADPATTTGANTIRYLVTNGQEKLLGLNGVAHDADLGADATITLASDLNQPTIGAGIDFTRADGIAANNIDAFAALAHEVSEGLFGRFMTGGGVPDGGTTNDYTMMDLFHFTSAGVRAMLQVNGNLLSFDGTTGDSNLNRVLDSSGDIADPGFNADPFNSFADAGTLGNIYEITQTDVRVLDVLGWTRANGLDDHAQSTATTADLSAGSTMNGNLELQGDHDWYRVTLNAAKNYAVLVNGAPTSSGTLFDPYTTLYANNSSRGTSTPLITADDGGVGNNSLLLTAAGASGTFYVDVGSNGRSGNPNLLDVGKGTYTVSLVEDDHRQDTAATRPVDTVAVNGSQTGNIEFVNDHDWFYLNLTSGKNYAIVVHGNGLPDPTIALRDSGGNLLAGLHNSAANNDADFGGGTPKDSRVLWSPGVDDGAGAGTSNYFLDVSASNGTDLGAYTVQVIEDDFRGDRFGNNGSVPVGTTATGKIQFETDHDWFKTTLTAGTSYAIQVKGSDTGNGTLADPSMGVYDSSGNAVAGTLLQDVSASNHNARMLLLPGATGDYYVDAFSNVGSDTNKTYGVQVQLASSLAKPNDFNGDGVSDILWRAPATGGTHIWLMKNFVVDNNQALDPLSGSVWKVNETGDFNGDLKSDILWRDTSGNLVEWQVGSGSTPTTINLGNPGLQWSVRGAGDFYGDGRSAILLRNDATGEVKMWEMDATGHVKQVDSRGVVSTAYHVVGVADFNGDGKAEILWRNTSGEVRLSNADGPIGATPGALQGTVGLGWHVAGTGDFYGDGKQEAVWVSSVNGAYQIGNSGTVLPSAAHQLTIQSTSTWKLVDVGDYNGDGKSDLLFRSTSGFDKIVEANGTEHAVPIVGLAEQVVHHNFEYV